MRKICRCDLCGNWTWSVRVRADHDVPLAVMVRGFRRALEGERGPFSFELIGQNDVLIPDVPTLCQRCFEEEFDSNRSATFGEFVDSLRRRKVH